jgi:magnesium transporter
MTRNGTKKRHRLFHRRSAPGTMPGTITADPEAPKPEIRVIAYGPDQIEEKAVADPAELPALLDSWPVVWVDVVGLGDANLIAAIGEVFGLHRLALEDVVNVHQRAKVEDYGDHVFIVGRMATEGPDFATEQLSMFLGKGHILTFQEKAGDCFDPVRNRIRNSKGKIRKYGTDYLAYALLDAIVDHYFPVLESYGDRLETLEAEILANPSAPTLGRIYSAKRDLISMRRVVWPQRESLSQLLRDPGDLVSDETQLYFRDCYDHAVQVMDLVESYREIAGGLVDAYLSQVSNRMNEVMKVLTIIATIFIPITFVAGVYGMNFSVMPELQWAWGYPAALLVMAGTTGGGSAPSARRIDGSCTVRTWRSRWGNAISNPSFAKRRLISRFRSLIVGTRNSSSVK